jgi:hypothetical protein
MKRSILALSLTFACGIAAYSQTAETRASGEATNQTSVATKQTNKSINLESGTRVAAELQSAIDVRKAKVGDQVILKTTEAIKSGGRIVVSKGSRLVGHVTDVAQKTGGNAESHVGILFDRLEQGSLAVPITATISSITSARANTRSNIDDMFAGNGGGSASSTGSARASSGGGLLGGAGSVVNSTTSTVGGVVGGTTSAVGSTVDSATSAVGNTTTGVSKSLAGIQIAESSNTSVEGGSVLSLQGANLRLDKGTNFNLVLTQSASAGTKTP